MVALSSLIRGKLFATKLVFDALTHFAPVEDCVRKFDDDTGIQHRARNDLCAFAQEHKRRVVVIQFVRGGEFGESAVRELLNSIQ